jgi:hypothetical protein
MIHEASFCFSSSLIWRLFIIQQDEEEEWGRIVTGLGKRNAEKPGDVDGNI